MSHISLGSISNNKNSLFRVSAVSDAGVPLEYSYYSGKLPPGLSVHPSGEIFGITKHHMFELDQNTTYFDNQSTTFDQLHTFVVKATNKDRPVTSTHEYSITERRLNTNQIANIYAKISPDKVTKNNFDRFVADTKIFDPDILYRMSDLNFQTGSRNVLILSGVEAPYLADLQDAFGRNFYNLKLKISNFAVGKARDPKGNVIYEVVYAELIDAYGTSPATVQDKINGSLLYVASINNIKNSLKENLNVSEFEYLPHWMKSNQTNQLATGYKLILPIRYVQPGQADRVLFKLENEQNFDLGSVFFQIDRLYIDKHKGTTIDETRTTATFVADGNTTSYILPQRVTLPKHVQVTIDGVSMNTVDNNGNPNYTVEPINDSSEQDSAGADSTALYSSILTFTIAPKSGSTITFQRKKTTFGVNDYVTFDKPDEALPKITADTIDISADADLYDTSYYGGVETTFDGQGTTFFSQIITFDQKTPEDTQLLFARENVMEGINNTSKHRDLIRKAS
jgi:hypothetical protein